MNIKKMMMGLGLAVVVALGIAGAQPTHAQQQPITPTGYYQQEYFNGGSSGFYFTTGTSGLTVVSLGYLAYNPLRPAGTQQTLSGSHDIGIYLVSTGALVGSATIPAGTTATGTFAYVPVTPFTLLAGTQYAIAGTEYSSQGNTPSADADPFARPTAVGTTFGYTYDGSAYTSSGAGGLQFPNVNNKDMGYFGPNFQVVPEPGTVAAFAFTGMGILALMLRARKGRRVSGLAV